MVGSVCPIEVGLEQAVGYRGWVFGQVDDSSVKKASHLELAPSQCHRYETSTSYYYPGPSSVPISRRPLIGDHANVALRGSGVKPLGGGDRYFTSSMGFP